MQKMSDCYQYALKHLTRFPKTTAMLRQHLEKRQFTLDEIDATIQKLQSSWYLDDATYATLYLQSEVTKKWKPYRLIQAKLIAKWIDRSIIQDQYDQIADECCAWMKQAIYRFYTIWLQQWVTEQKLTEKLLRKWYEYGLIKEVKRDFE